jgi:hypothetical protein
VAVVLHQIAEKIQVFRLPVSVILPFSENCVPFVNDNHYPPSIIRINIIQCLDQIVIAEIINIRIFLKYIDDKWDGKVENYLISNGMTESEINALRDKCVG